MDPRRKILDHEAADAWVAAERSAGLRIGFTCGSFDLLHPGHVQCLEAARGLCDRLMVAVNTDESVRRYKSPLRPVHPLDHRMYMVAGLGAVDAVTHLDEDRPLGLLLRWKPDLYIKGGDYEASGLRSGDAVRAYGGRVEVIRPEFSTSTTALIERISALAAHAEPERLAAQPPAGLVLLDRDGTLIRNIPYLSDPDGVELLPGVGEGLARLQEAGLRLAIVSNQQAIGLGFGTAQDFVDVNRRLFRELAPFGVRISKVYFCPHTIADRCDCRKPAAGMIRRALRDFNVAPGQAYLVGDAEGDMQAGAAAGCTTVFVGDAPSGPSDFHAAMFADAAEWIAAHAAAPVGRSV
jgi:rfaE bifunctional protein nucleotidyltransferase chain/domain